MIPHSKPGISESDIKAVVAALRKRHLAHGTETDALEKSISKMFDGAEVIAVSSGTAALYLALTALDVKAGNKVVIPSYTCNSLYAAVSLAGARAVCADTGMNSVNIDRATIEPLLDQSVKAIIVPHMFGYRADIGPVKKLGIPVIEDCAQAVGGRYPDGTLLGTMGDIAILSFFATKLLPAGEGGACITRNSNIAALIRSLRDCDKQLPRGKAFNFKMTDISAALACSKLRGLKADLRKRFEIAARYDKAFGDASFRAKLDHGQPVCFRYLVSAQDDAGSFIRKAKTAGIICTRPVWKPLHHSLGGACPEIEELEKKLVSVPIYPALRGAEIKRICSKLPDLII